MKTFALLPIAMLIVATAGAQAQPVRSERNISLEVASQIATAGVAACQEKGFNVTVTVVDRAGLIRAVQRADQAGPHTIDSSRAKAYTAVSMKTTTQALMELAQKNPAAANLVHIPGLLLLGGGVPIKVGDEVIGGVGVGGAPGGHLDEQCALEALDKVKPALN